MQLNIFDSLLITHHFYSNNQIFISKHTNNPDITRAIQETIYQQLFASFTTIVYSLYAKESHCAYIKKDRKLECALLTATGCIINIEFGATFREICV